MVVVRKRELVRQIGGLRGELAAKERARAEWEDRARQMRYELRQARLAGDEAVARYNSALQLLAHAQDENTKLLDRLERLQTDVIKLAARPPHVIDASDAIAKITAGIADVLNGGMNQQSYAVDQAEQYPMSEHVGEVDPHATTRFFVPETEMDTRWNGPLPTPGEWAVTTPSILTEDQTPSHTTDAQGNLVRTDGQPMFQAGTGQTKPPSGGIE